MPERKLTEEFKMRINHNVVAMNTANNLGNVNSAQGKVLEKLGSGQRINRAADDAAGIAISEKMRGELAFLKQSKSNSQDLVSFTNAADGALNEISNIMVNIQQLATQSGDGAASSGSVMMNSTATGNIGSTITAYSDAIKKFVAGEMNGLSLLSTSQLAKAGVTDTSSALDKVQAITAGSDIATIRTAVDSLNTLRASIGARSNQAESTVRNLSTQMENLQEAESRIRDTDMAETTVEFQKNNILNQAATAMLSQANQLPQSVTGLLR